MKRHVYAVYDHGADEYQIRVLIDHQGCCNSPNQVVDVGLCFRNIEAVESFHKEIREAVIECRERIMQ